MAGKGLCRLHIQIFVDFLIRLIDDLAIGGRIILPFIQLDTGWNEPEYAAYRAKRTRIQYDNQDDFSERNKRFPASSVPEPRKDKTGQIHRVVVSNLRGATLPENIITKNRNDY